MGNYRVERFVREGAAGRVYEAQHQVLRKRHALKVIHEGLMRDESFMSDFRYEARLLAALDHPHIVRVTDFGEDDGRCFFVMDYISGPDGAARTLQDEMGPPGDTLPLPEDRVIEVALQICDALQYAHGFGENGLVHRDLKPSNILLREGKGGKTDIAIADFGLARMLGNDEALKTMYFDPQDADTLTQSSKPVNRAVTGTPPYMSPEQWVPGTRISPASDIYSFGVILHQMLTGDLPYPDSRVLTEYPPRHTLHPPSEYGLKSLWDLVVKRCLAPLPRDRYGSIEELAAAIRTIGHRGAKVEAFVTTPETKKSKRRLWPAVVAGLVLAGVGYTGYSLRQEALRDGPVDVKVMVEPAGARLVLSRSGEVVVQKDLIPENGLTLKLEQGVYSFDVSKDGYGRHSGEFAVNVSNKVFRAQLEEPTGKVRVESVPDTEVRMLAPDQTDVVLGTTDGDGALYLELKVGAYDLIMVHPDYFPATNAVTVTEEKPVRLVEALLGLPAQVKVTSEVSGTVLYHDEVVGRTGEALGPYEPGDYSFLLQRPGYRDETLEVTLQANEEHVVAAPPVSLLPGRLVVLVTLPELDQWRILPVEGELQVGDGPFETVSLPAEVVLPDDAVYTVRLHVSSYKDIELEDIQVKAGEVRRETVELTPKLATVRFSTTVPNAKVFLEEKEVGLAGEILEVEPYVHHEFEVRAPGYSSRRVEVIATDPDAETTEYRVELDAMPPVLRIEGDLPPGFDDIAIVEVFVDGESYGRVTLPYETEKLSPGEHRVQLVDPRWDEIEPQTVDLQPGENHTLTIPLQYAATFLEFDVMPTNAVVKLDGASIHTNKMAVTPYVTYTVQLSAPDHESVTLSHLVVPGRDRVIKASLEPLTLLRLEVEPQDARVLLDNREVVGNRIELEPGVAHRLQVEASGYKSWSEEVRLEAGEQRSVVVELKKKRFSFGFD